MSGARGERWPGGVGVIKTTSRTCSAFSVRELTMRTPVRRAVAEVWTNHVGVDPTWTAQQTEAFFDQEAQRLSDRINVLSAEAGPTAVAEWTRVNGRTPVGLVRRVENMVADTAHYRDELNCRHEHALTRIGELEAVADEPFEHTDALRDKRHRLDTLTAALQTSADSPEAKAKETEHQQRLDARGREPGWSLALNPTPALRAEFGDAELARRAGHSGGGSDTWGLVGCRGGCGTRRPGGGTGVIGCAACGAVGLSWRRGPRWRGRLSRRIWRWRGCGRRSLRAWLGTGC